MKKLDSYIIREMILPFIIGTFAVVLMFQANLLIAQLKNLELQAIPPLALFKIILYKTPFFLNMTLPVGISLAASLAFSRIARESELTAMRSAGARILRVVLPVAFFGFVVAVGNFFLVEKVMPPSEKAARKMFREVGVLAAIPTFQSNAVIYLRNGTASFAEVRRGSEGEILLKGIDLFERPRPGEIMITSADSGIYRDGVWTLKNPYMRWLKDDDLLLAKPEKDLIINERIVIGDLFQSPEPEEQTAAQLKKAIALGKKVGKKTTRQEVAYHVRYSVPASCLIFAFVAPVFAISFGRSGGFLGVLLSIILVFLYYNAYVISTEILGRNGWVSPWLSAWLPNFIFVALGFIGLRRLE